MCLNQTNSLNMLLNRSTKYIPELLFLWLPLPSQLQCHFPSEQATHDRPQRQLWNESQNYDGTCWTRIQEMPARKCQKINTMLQITNGDKMQNTSYSSEASFLTIALYHKPKYSLSKPVREMHLRETAQNIESPWTERHSSKAIS